MEDERKLKLGHHAAALAALGEAAAAGGGGAAGGQVGCRALRSGGDAEEFFQAWAIAFGAMGFFVAADE